MAQWFVELVLKEGTWLPVAMLLAFVAAGAALLRCPGQRRRERLTILGAMDRFYGCMLGVMACGHLLAVKLSGMNGTLKGSPWFLYPLGLALAVPAWWLFLDAARLAAGDARRAHRTALLNACLGILLLAFGLHNAPLAAPAALNLAYQFHRRPAVGWAIVTIALAASLALFAGAVNFMASGKTFEEFTGM